MEYLWIFSAIAAAFFQSMRLGALKQLNQTLSVTATSYVRVPFTLPFLAVYLLGLCLTTGEPLPAVNARFLFCACVAALGQFVGTVVLVRLFQLGNFAVGTMLQKTDVLMTAIIGSIFFSEVISAGGWLAILVTGLRRASDFRCAPACSRPSGSPLRPRPNAARPLDPHRIAHRPAVRLVLSVPARRHPVA
jgi:hypothetical protein